jgi:hypothetical protein
MSWKKKFTEKIADTLRFAAYIFLAFDAIVLSGFLFWLVVKFVLRFAQYIDHHIFENPWY